MKNDFIKSISKVTANVFTLVFIVLFYCNQAMALTALDGDFTLHGKMITQVGVHLQDSKTGGADFDTGDFSMASTLVDLEASLKLHDQLSIAAIGRVYKNWVYNIEDAYQTRFQDTGRGFLDPQNRYNRSWNKNSEEWTEDFDLREIYLDIGLGNNLGNLRLGRQQITWGESDGIRLADIINPLNIGYHFNLESWEDIRIPIWAAYLNFIPPSFEDWTLDVVYTQDFQRAVRGEPGSGSNWAFPIPNNARSQPMPGADLIPYFYFDEPDRSSSNAEYGARVSYKSNFSGMEFSAFYFHGFNDLPILEYRGEMQEGPQPVPLPPIYLVFDEYDNYGFTFNLFSETLKTVFRGEFVYIDDIGFNAASPGFDPFAPPNAVLFHKEERDQYKCMLGFDRNTFIRSLNRLKSFYMSGQYFYLYTDDTDGLIDSTYTDMGIEDDTHILTFMVNTAYMQEQLAPFILFLWSPDDKWWQVQTNLTYTSTDFHWKYTLGANLMGGESNFAEMGLFENHNEVYFKMQYSF